MPLTIRTLQLYALAIFLVWIVDATIEIFDSSGRKVDRFFDREAPLDDEIDDMEGFIMLTDPSDACSPVAEPPFLTNFSYFKFALINGSEICGCKRKIHMAGAAGYDFAIIFDPTTGPLQYLGFGFEPHIPTVLISHDDGLIIRNNYLYNTSSNKNFRIHVKPNIADLSYYMYLFGAVIGVCFFVMILFMMCLLIKCIQERRKNKRNRLSSRQIKQIPTAKFSKGDQYDVCAICLEDYNEGDKLRILPCSHAYHAKCIDPWLMNNRRNCPLCKRKITFGDSADESDSEDSELTSPAENTPLLTSPSNHGQTWGTFGNTVQPVNSHDTGGPSSLPDSYSDVNTPIYPEHPVTMPSTANWFVSDSESECLLPPALFSVNNERPERNSNQNEVKVNFANPFEGETSSNHNMPI